MEQAGNIGTDSALNNETRAGSLWGPLALLRLAWRLIQPKLGTLLPIALLFGVIFGGPSIVSSLLNPMNSPTSPARPVAPHPTPTIIPYPTSTPVRQASIAGIALYATPAQSTSSAQATPSYPSPTPMANSGFAGQTAFWSAIFAVAGVFILIFIVIIVVAVTITLLIQGIFILAMIHIIRTQQPLTISQAFSLATQDLIPYWTTSLLQVLLIFVASLLFIIPGIILAIWYSFVPYIVVEEKLRGKAALAQSRHYVSGYWWPILGRIIVYGLITVVPLEIVVIWARFYIPVNPIIVAATIALSSLITPLNLTYQYVLYRNVRSLKSADPFATPLDTPVTTSNE